MVVRYCGVYALRIIVMGAGGLGSFLGARLANTDHQVTFIARGENLKALRTHGIRLEEPISDVVLDSVSATDDPLAAGPADVIIVGVKSWQVAETAPLLKPLIGDRTVVLAIQNGVEAADKLGSVLGGQHVLGGACAIASYLVGPGHVYHFGGRPWMTLGPIVSVPKSIAAVVEQLREALCSAGVECPLSPDIRRSIWQKFLLVTSTGGIGAVTRMPVGITRSLAQTRQLVEEAMNEVLLVGRAHGVALDEGDVQTMMRQFDELPPDTTSSMERDIAAGRRSELPDLSGAVVRLAAQVNVVPRIHQFIYWSLLPSELRAVGADWTVKPWRPERRSTALRAG